MDVDRRYSAGYGTDRGTGAGAWLSSEEAGRRMRGHLPAPPSSRLGFVGQKSTIHPPMSSGLPRAVPGSLPRIPTAAPAQPDFVGVGGHRWDTATSTWPWGHVRARGGCLTGGQDERSIALKRNSNPPFPLIRLLTAQSKYFYKSGISLPICISDLWWKLTVNMCKEKCSFPNLRTFPSLAVAPGKPIHIPPATQGCPRVGGRPLPPRPPSSRSG